MKIKNFIAKKAYLVTFCLFSSIYTLNGVKTFGPPIKAVSHQIARDIQKEFPKNLEVIVSNGEIYSNFSFPVLIKTPTILQSYLTRNFFVIDPEGQEEMLIEYDAFALINNYGITILTPQGFQSVPLSKVPTIVINETNANKVAEKLIDLGNKANLMVGLYFFAQSTYKFLVVYTIYLIIMAILGFFIIHKDISGFKNRLRLCTMTFIPLFVVTSVLQIIKIRVPLFPWFFILHVLTLIYVSYKITTNKNFLNYFVKSKTNPHTKNT